MTNPEQSGRGNQLEEAVASRVRQKAEAERQGDRGMWFGLGMFGLIGWSVSIPTLLGAAIGIWIDSRFDGPHSWTLMLLMLGVTIGCVNAWVWVSRETEDFQEADGDRNDESLNG